MALPAPDLDDRRFQDLVDEAKRFVQRRCPEWTDHNVSDPGVTLIEAFAAMVDQLLYRLNQVPERHYLRFLDMIGVHLLPPTDAQTDVTFWLSSPLPDVLPVPVGTEVATMRTERDEPVTFSVVDPLDIVPCQLIAVGSMPSGGHLYDSMKALASGRGFDCFSAEPQPGDALFMGLDTPVPRCVLALRFSCTVEGVGVDPTNPPLVWEVWTGRSWTACGLERDETGGLNRAGDVVLHVPRDHTMSTVAGRRAAWVRCRLLEVDEGEPTYTASPHVTRLSVHTIGGTTRVAHGEVIDGEILGASEGVPGQRLPLKRRPVIVTDEPVVVEVTGAEGWDEWTRVESFADSGPADRHFVLDPVGGEVAFGPAVRESDGSLRHYGAVPDKDAVVRIPRYRTGGGQAGNVARGAISVLKSSIPYITRVENRAAAIGGVDTEDVDAAKVRGPIVMRTRNRAVTVEDYEELAREAAPHAARIRCVPAGADDGGGVVRVLVVPALGDRPTEPIDFAALTPPEPMLAAINDYLDQRRVIGARVVVEPAFYTSMTIVARVRARPKASPRRLQANALAALYAYFNPVSGGADGRGWPFGRPVHVGEIY